MGERTGPIHPTTGRSGVSRWLPWSMRVPLLAALLLLVFTVGCARDVATAPTEAASSASEPVPSSSEAQTPQPSDTETSMTETDETQPVRTELATFGAGCFWCVEAVFERLDGVEDVTSGYMGGHVENPTYKQICTGTTGHAEVVQITFRPDVIEYAELLDWFWRSHDPTTLNRQGADVGTQYRSAIFTHSEEQAAVARKSLAAADLSGAFADPIVTEITPASTYYEAEVGHQDYYRLNARAPYCQVVIRPKLDKLGLTE